MPYYLFKDGLQGGTKYAYTCNVAEYETQLIIKAKISCTERGSLQIKLGKSNNSMSVYPTEFLAYKIFNYQGGDYYMNGLDDTPLEVAIDFEDNLGINNIGKIFLQSETRNVHTYNPNKWFIQDFSIIDYRWNEEFQLDCPITYKTIENNSTTTLGIEYDLLPFDTNITDSTYSTNKVARRTINTADGSVITMDNMNLDMYGTDLYDCEFVIGAGSALNIQDTVSIVAKRGKCRMVIMVP